MAEPGPRSPNSQRRNPEAMTFRCVLALEAGPTAFIGLSLSYSMIMAMATALVSGRCALITEWTRRQSLSAPVQLSF
jgi:hypothetical protein